MKKNRAGSGQELHVKFEYFRNFWHSNKARKWKEGKERKETHPVCGGSVGWNLMLIREEENDQTGLSSQEVYTSFFLKKKKKSLFILQFIWYMVIIFKCPNLYGFSYSNSLSDMQKNHNLSPPAWVTPDVMNKLKLLSDFSYRTLFGIYKREEKARLQGGIHYLTISDI